MNYQGYKWSYVDKEVPQGIVNGVNTIFTISSIPLFNTEYLYLNGVLLEREDDYTISGNTITMIVIPQTNDKLRISYRK